MTLSVSEILEELRLNRGYFPREAVEAAVERRDEVVPELLRILDETIDRPEELLEGARMDHLYALYLLTQLRVPEAFPRILRLFRLPGELGVEITGYVATEDLHRMLATLSDGDVRPIQELIEDPEVGEWVRGAGLFALQEMVLGGQLPREEVVAYLGELLGGRLEREPSNVWSCLVSIATDLHATELADEIHRGYAEGLVDPFVIGLDEVEEAFCAPREAVLNESRRRSKGPIEDTVREMHWWACFHPRPETARERRARAPLPVTRLVDEPSTPFGQSIVREGPKVGRNDPCPCGSGKKYKKCCLRLDREAGVAASAAGMVRRAARESPGWEVDVVPVPGTVRGDPASRLAVLLVVAGGVGIHSKPLDRPSAEPEAMAAVMADEIRKAAAKVDWLPERVLVRERCVAEALEARLASESISESASESGQEGRSEQPVRAEAGPLPGLDDLAYALLEEQGAPPDRVRVSTSETWAAWGLPEEVLNRLLRACQAFYRADPWPVLGDWQPLEAVASSGGSWTVFLLGRQAEEPGVLLFSDPRDLEDMLSWTTDEDGFQDLEGRILDLSFESEMEAPRALKRELAAAGWEISETCPCLLAFNTPAGGLRRADAEDLAAILEAVPRFVEEHHESLGDADAGDPGALVEGWRDEATGVELSYRPPPGLDSVLGAAEWTAPEYTLEDYENAPPYDPDEGPDPEAWLELSKDDRILAVAAAHREEIDPDDVIGLMGHALLQSLVETHVAEGDETPAAAKLEELTADGLSRHEALHAIGAITTILMMEITNGLLDVEAEDPMDRYRALLGELTARGWLESAEEMPD